MWLAGKTQKWPQAGMPAQQQVCPDMQGRVAVQAQMNTLAVQAQADRWLAA